MCSARPPQQPPCAIARLRGVVVPTTGISAARANDLDEHQLASPPRLVPSWGPDLIGVLTHRLIFELAARSSRAPATRTEVNAIVPPGLAPTHALMVAQRLWQLSGCWSDLFDPRPAWRLSD